MTRLLMILFVLAAACGNPYKNDSDTGTTGPEAEALEVIEPDPEETETTPTEESTEEPETDPADDYEGDDPGECTDRADNDRNGLFDCDDPGCAGSPDCQDSNEEPEQTEEPTDDDPTEDPEDPTEDPTEGTTPTDAGPEGPAEDPTEPEDPVEDPVDTCVEWSATFTFDDETDTSETLQKWVSMTVTHEDGTESIEVATFEGGHNLFFDDNCFSLPEDGDIRLCARGHGGQEGDTYFDGSLLTLQLPAGLEANWLSTEACDFDQGLELTAFDASGSQVGEVSNMTSPGEDACHTTEETAAWELAVLWTSVELWAPNFPGAAEAAAYNYISVGKDCPMAE